jgi:pimeloyl-ACP methyl ester carboxylesterase
LNSWRRALRFIATQQRGARNSGRIDRRAVTIVLGKECINADVYTPPQAEAPTIVFLHGMSPLGISDPRQIVAAKALASAGFRVVCPELPEIRNLKVAADVQLAGSITAVAALGAFSRMEGTLSHLMHVKKADPYVRLIILANFLPRLKDGKRLGRYYIAAANDNWQETASKNPSLHGFEPTDERIKALRRLNAKERELVARIEDDAEFRLNLAQRLLPVMRRELSAYNVLKAAGSIKAAVFLLHGAEDDVIPARESMELFPVLRDARLVVTPFMGHSHAAVSLRLIGDVVKLVAGFAWFFRKAAQ